jgi:hypothetical protein
MVLEGNGLKSNEEMAKNTRETGSPFGKDKKPSKDKLYCC